MHVSAPIRNASLSPGGHRGGILLAGEAATLCTRTSCVVLVNGSKRYLVLHDVQRSDQDSSGCVGGRHHEGGVTIGKLRKGLGAPVCKYGSPQQRRRSLMPQTSANAPLQHLRQTPMRARARAIVQFSRRTFSFPVRCRPCRVGQPSGYRSVVQREPDSARIRPDG